MRKMRKATISMICIAEALLIIGSTAACGAKDGDVAPHELVHPDEIQQEPVQPKETQQEPVQSNETIQTAAQQNTNQPVPSDDGQISLEDAKSEALADAGVSDAEVIYTKEKSDYENGIMIYDIEFYVGNVEYEYEINAATGEVYSKSVDTHYDQTGHGHHGHNGHTGTADSYIGNDSAESIALNHAGFSETEVSRLKSEFDIDDGLAVYEVEFDKDGREYEYTINATDSSIIEYDVD